MIAIDAEKRELNLQLSASEIKRRLRSWKAPRLRYRHGVLAKYAKQVSSASYGAITD